MQEEIKLFESFVEDEKKLNRKYRALLKIYKVKSVVELTKKQRREFLKKLQ